MNPSLKLRLMRINRDGGWGLTEDETVRLLAEAILDLEEAVSQASSFQHVHAPGITTVAASGPSPMWGQLMEAAGQLAASQPVTEAGQPMETVSTTTDKPWAAPEPESTAAKTQLSSLSDLQSISTGLAAAFSLFADRLAVLSAHGRTRALDVDSTT